MNVKFELEDMTDILDLTPGKEYDFNESEGTIVDDVGCKIWILTDKGYESCPHLQDRSIWSFVK